MVPKAPFVITGLCSKSIIYNNIIIYCLIEDLHHPRVKVPSKILCLSVKSMNLK